MPVEMNQRSQAMADSPRVQTGMRDGVLLLGYVGSWNSLRALEQVDGAFYEERQLWFPATRTNVLLVETIGKLEDCTTDYLEHRGRLLTPPPSEIYPRAPLTVPLPLTHQKEAHAFARAAFREGHSGFANWSECGTGKTRWAIDMARSLGAKITVVVGQKSTLSQWAGEIGAIWFDAEITLLSGPLKKRALQILLVAHDARQDNRPRVILLNWEVLNHLGRVLMKCPITLAIFDESSRAKNRTSLMSKMARRVAHHSQYRVCLSGTPIGNDPADLWAQYELLEPGLFPRSFREFVAEYFHLGGVMGTQFIGFRNESLSRFIEKIYSIGYRVTKATVSDMPEKLQRVQRLSMLPEQERIYRSVEADLYAEAHSEDGDLVRLNVNHALVRVLRLQQVTAGLMAYNTTSGDDQFLQDVESGRCQYRSIPSAKTVWMQEFVQESVETTDAKIIIWTRFLAEVWQLSAVLGTGPQALGVHQFGWIDGGVDHEKRERLRRNFNDRESPLRVLICQIQAAAYGLDLPAADILIYHSQSFSYTDRKQSEDRGHRVGRVRPYQIIDLVLEDTVDEVCLKAIRRKQSLSDLLLSETSGGT